MSEDARWHVRESNEIDRITDELTGEFDAVAPPTIEAAVRAEFDRRHDARVQDFVPIFVERSLRHKLRSTEASTPEHV
jgi:hypothetical protein